jgi:uncharacterized protein DUF1259
MKGNLAVAGVIVTTVAISLTQSTRAQTSGGFDTAGIEQGTGLKGQLIAQEGVLEVSNRRRDMQIIVDQWTMPPFMGLTSWAAFTRAHIDSQGAMTSDTVVFEDELNPVMNAAFDAGLEVTALHDHFLFGDPQVYFMHIGGHDETRALAAAAKTIHDKVSETRAAYPMSVTSFPGNIASPSSITAAPLETALGMKGQANQGMFVIGRTATMHGLPVGKKMGVSTWAAVAGGDEEAVAQRCRENDVA